MISRVHMCSVVVLCVVWWGFLCLLYVFFVWLALFLLFVWFVYLFKPLPKY